MKSLTIMFIYICTGVGMYLALSLIGVLFGESYINCIHNGNWAMMYIILIGWWIPIFPCREYYAANQEYMDRVF